MALARVAPELEMVRGDAPWPVLSEYGRIAFDENGSAMMTDHPLPFTASQIRAMLDGRKRQDRRPLSRRWKFGSAPKEFWDHADFMRAWPDPGLGSGGYLKVPCHMSEDGEGEPGGIGCVRCEEMGWPSTTHRLYPPWEIGDRIWVRESWRATDTFNGWKPGDIPSHNTPFYEATPTGDSIPELGPLRSPIHMPRWASRLTLIVESVRVQRLQDISDGDARAEGISVLPLQDADDPSAWWQSDPGEHQARTPVGSYRLLWGSLHGPGAWSLNPWVAAIGFRVIRANIDSPEAR